MLKRVLGLAAVNLRMMDPSEIPGRRLDAQLGVLVQAREEGLIDGIGLSNVNERLRVIYGARSAVSLSTELGRGTSVRLEIPDIVAEERASA